MKITGGIFMATAILVGAIGLFFVGAAAFRAGNLSVAPLIFMAIGNIGFAVAMFVAGLVMVRRANGPQEITPDLAAKQVGSPG